MGKKGIIPTIGSGKDAFGWQLVRTTKESLISFIIEEEGPLQKGGAAQPLGGGLEFRHIINLKIISF